jgi:hypothetical protein
MAPGPRVKIAEDIEFLQNEKDHTHEEDDDDEPPGGRPPLRYYKSKHVLGELYRAVDEKSFLDGFQRVPRDDSSSLLEELWRYVKHETAGFIWDHHIEGAKDIQEM